MKAVTLSGRSVLRRRGRGFLLSLALGLAGCSHGSEAEPPPVRHQTAAEEILRIGEVWTSMVAEKKLFSPPSPISMSRGKRTSAVTLGAESATEQLTVEETVELRSGVVVQCKTVFEHPLRVRYGHRVGEAAVELVRPPLRKQRSCDGTHPDPLLTEDSRRALFVLRSDQLVVVEPALDDRAYLPQPY